MIVPKRVFSAAEKATMNVRDWRPLEETLYPNMTTVKGTVSLAKVEPVLNDE